MPAPIHWFRAGWRSLRAARLAAWIGFWAVPAVGCAWHTPPVPMAELSQRILPPLPLPSLVADPVADVPACPCADDSIPLGAFRPPLAGSDHGWEPLTLEQAIAWALRTNPGLQARMERIAQAEGGRQVSFADFLPEANVSLRRIDGTPGRFALPTLPSAVGNVAYGGTAHDFWIGEFHLQWTIWDFGRTMARYGRAVAALDIARLQYLRARQTLVYQVAVSYFDLLQARANRIIAEEAVRRAEAHLRDARNFLKEGTAIRHDVLRAEVQVAEMRLLLVQARTAEGIARAGLNQLIGINVSTPTQIVDQPDEPTWNLSLEQGLRLAVDHREEFRVVLQGIAAAQFGAQEAKAAFWPRIYVGGTAALQDGRHLDQHELISGGVNIELGLYEGGRRKGQLVSAKAEVRAAIAQAKEVCDRIAYEVTAAFLAMDDARQRIELSQSMVTQAEENIRVVGNLFRRGDATPTEVVDAELTWVRARQNYAAALYDYQTALARLQYAIGTTRPAEECGDE
ncbi:MAG: TolC family protein [Gemmataceae bacterium]